MEEVQSVQIIVLISGIALYPLLTFVAYRLAVQSFRRVGL
jgi:hypothetical protein